MRWSARITGRLWLGPGPSRRPRRPAGYQVQQATDESRQGCYRSRQPSKPTARKPSRHRVDGRRTSDSADERASPSCRDLTRCCQAASRLVGGCPPRAEWPRRVL
jgi:hypothetical protein